MVYDLAIEINYNSPSQNLQEGIAVAVRQANNPRVIWS